MESWNHHGGPRRRAGIHVRPEDVTLLVVEQGSWRLGESTRVEVGTVDVGVPALPAEWVDVSFDTPFAEVPVVLAQVQSQNGPDWDIVRVRNVTEAGFQLTLQEVEANDGTHWDESVGWLAIDSGQVMSNGIAIDAFATERAFTDTPGVVEFDPSVGEEPLVAAMIATFAGVDPANLRIAETADGRSTFRVWEDESVDTREHIFPEALNGLAFSEEGLLTGSVWDFA